MKGNSYGMYPNMGAMRMEVLNVEPFVVAALNTVIGSRVVVETVRGF